MLERPDQRHAGGGIQQPHRTVLTDGDDPHAVWAETRSENTAFMTEGTT